MYGCSPKIDADMAQSGRGSRLEIYHIAPVGHPISNGSLMAVQETQESPFLHIKLKIPCSVMTCVAVPIGAAARHR